MNPFQIVAIFVLAFILLTLYLKLTGAAAKGTTLRAVFGPFTLFFSLLFLALLAFELWFWKYPLLRPWLSDTPDVSGTWEASILYDTGDPKTNWRTRPITGYMRIEQTNSKISMRLMTKEITYDLLAPVLEKPPLLGFRIFGTYLDKPGFSFRDEYQNHHGAIRLYGASINPTSIEGHYWTSARTRGAITLSKKNPHLYETFEAARAAFPAELPPENSGTCFKG